MTGIILCNHMSVAARRLALLLSTLLLLAVASSSDKYDFVNCNRSPCDTTLYELSANDVKRIADETMSDVMMNPFVYFISGFKGHVQSMVKYGVQVRKVCSSCKQFYNTTDFASTSSSSCFNDYCGTDSYGYDATVSGLAIIPMDPNVRGDILPGILKTNIWSRMSRAATCNIPSEKFTWLFNGNKAGATDIDIVAQLIIASSGTVSISADNLGYGESYNYFKSYIQKNTYKTAAIPIYLETQQMIATETQCQSELSNTVVVSGNSEGGYGALSIAEGLECLSSDIDIVKVYGGSGPYRISSTIVDIVESIQDGWFPKSFHYVNAFLGTSYSSTNPHLPNSNVDGDNQNLLSDEWLDTILTLTSSGATQSEIINILPSDPLEIFNENFLSFIKTAIARGDTDPCRNPGTDKTGVDKICAAFIENDLRSYLNRDEGHSYPIELCHSPQDDVISISNVLPAFSDMYVDGALGPHPLAAVTCVRRFTEYFDSKTYDDIVPKESGWCNSNKSGSSGAKEEESLVSLLSSVPSSMPSYEDGSSIDDISDISGKSNLRGHL